jgi:hypothetical protein
MLKNDFHKKSSIQNSSSKGSIFVSKIVKETCSVYMDKGRMSSISSKLLMTKPKCVRMAK